jgi:hypothetical protein
MINFTLNCQLKKWNERWIILDPATGKMEYKYENTCFLFFFWKLDEDANKGLQDLTLQLMIQGP